MIQFYKPNAKNSGSACSFRYSSKDDCVFVNFIRQAGWDDVKKRGSFSGNAQNPKASCYLKLNSTEMADIISAIRRNSDFKSFHDSQKQVTRINFTPYSRVTKDSPDKPVQVGFSFGVSKESKENAQDKTSFVIGLTYGEAVKLEAFFSLLLIRIFEKAIQDQANYQKPTDDADQAAPAAKPAAAKVADDDDGW